jgi:anti-sigma B factor antagonist
VKVVDINYRFIGGVAIVSLSGRLTISPGESEIVPLQVAIGELLSAGQVHVSLELSRVTHIDARGLAGLVEALTSVRRAGGELSLIAPSPRVKQLLGVTRLDTVFPVREAEPAVLGIV